MLSTKQLIKASIKSVTIHWSESRLVNDELGSDENFDINKDFDIEKIEDLFDRAGMRVDGGYDKTKFTVNFHGGETFGGRIDLNTGCKSLIDLLEWYATR